MDQPKLFILQESLPGKRDLVRGIWDRHMQTQSDHSRGFIAATYSEDPFDFNKSHVALAFQDQQSREAFEESSRYIEYLWEVLPLLAHKPRITDTLPEEALPRSTASRSRGHTRTVNGEQEMLHTLKTIVNTAFHKTLSK